MISADHVKKALNDNESRVQGIAQGRVKFDILVNLILKQIRVTDPRGFHFRHIGTGKSNSEVLLLVETPGGLRVIKCGPLKEIETEYRHFDTDLKPPALALRMSDQFRPGEFTMRGPDDIEHTHAAASSRVVGDCTSVETLRSALKNPAFTLSDILTAFDSLGTELADWQRCSTEPTISPKLPFGQFPWLEESKENILSALDAYQMRTGCAISSKLRELITNPENPPERWLDQLKGVKTNRVGVCHGDLNSQNVLIGTTSSSPVRAFVIDFFWASEGKYSPALDWAKLERDVKLRGLTDATDTNPELFTTHLCLLNINLRSGDFEKGDDTHIGKCIGLISKIRQQYSEEFRGPGSRIEYLYYLLCWHLAYLNTEEFHAITENGDSARADAFVKSAIDTFQILDESITNFGSPKTITAISPAATADEEAHTINGSRKHIKTFVIFAVIAVVIGMLVLATWSYVPATQHQHRLFVHIFDPNGNPVQVQDVELDCSVPCFIKTINGYWEIEIPDGTLGKHREFVLRASVPARFLRGSSTVPITDGTNSVDLKLSHPETFISGMLKDDTGKPLPHVRIGLATFPAEAVTTSPLGEFSFPAHAAPGESVRLSIYGQKIELITDFYQVGNQVEVTAVTLQNK
jgi:hypothetical protein